MISLRPSVISPGRIHCIQGVQWIPVSWIVTTEHKIKIERSYYTLNIPNGSDQETIRQAYIDLAKRFHPDSGSAEADSVKFQEIDKAFRILLKEKSIEQNAKAAEDVAKYVIKHTAPQHRQYLSYEGVGFGSPTQRQKQWAKVRASNAAINVMEHRIAKAAASETALLDKNKQKHKHDIKTKYGFDRLVEDLIQEAMSKGEFNNLKGSGKALDQNRNMNPYVDFVTHKINQILIDNGFTPEWIMLQKEIRIDIEKLQNGLGHERMRLGKNPLSSEEEFKWTKSVERFMLDADNINQKINKYNLLVPLVQKQMFNIFLDKEAKMVLETGKTKFDCADTPQQPKAPENIHDGQPSTLFGAIFSAFKL